MTERIPVRLVPVEIFGEDNCCEHGENAECKSAGYGLSDAVSAWSDCNRAIGHIYRFEDTYPEPDGGRYREPGDTLVVWVDPDEFAAFSARNFDSDAAPREQVQDGGTRAP
jgi:hypothetical protein